MTINEAMQRFLDVPEGREWFESRPQVIQELVRKMPPGTWWHLLTGQNTTFYTPAAYNEDGTVTVGRFDTVLPFVPYSVFGCSPDDFIWTDMSPDALGEDRRQPR